MHPGRMHDETPRPKWKLMDEVFADPKLESKRHYGLLVYTWDKL